MECDTWWLQDLFCSMNLKDKMRFITDICWRKIIQIFFKRLWPTMSITFQHFDAEIPASCKPIMVILTLSGKRLQKLSLVTLTSFFFFQYLLNSFFIYVSLSPSSTSHTSFCCFLKCYLFCFQLYLFLLQGVDLFFKLISLFLLLCFNVYFLLYNWHLVTFFCLLETSLRNLAITFLAWTFLFCSDVFCLQTVFLYFAVKDQSLIFRLDSASWYFLMDSSSAFTCEANGYSVVADSSGDLSLEDRLTYSWKGEVKLLPFLRPSSLSFTF